MKKIFFLMSVCLVLNAQRWVHQYGSSGDNCAYRVVYGDDGNIYACGYAEETNYDIVVISYTTDGVIRWIQTYNGPGDGSDRAYDIVYGADGNIYIAGEAFSGTGVGGKDALVLSYTSSGSLRWEYRYNGPLNLNDNAKCIVYGNDGNLYIGGRCDLDDWGLTSKAFVFSLNTSGNLRWVHRFTVDSVGSGNTINSIVYGNDGDVYVVGTNAVQSNNPDFIVASFTSSGSLRWYYRYNAYGTLNDRGYDIVYGDDGYIYAVGEGAFDWTVLSFTTTGTLRWSYTSGISTGGDKGYSITYGSDGNIYSAGYTPSETYSTNFAVLSINNSGSFRWLYEYNPEQTNDNRAEDIVYGNDGNVYAVGHIYISGNGWELAVLKFDNTGSLEGYATYGESQNDDLGYSIAYGSDYNLYIGGKVFQSEIPKFTVLSYSTSQVSITESPVEISLPLKFKINSISPYFVFSVSLSSSQSISISLFDMVGRKRYTLINGKYQPGIYSFTKYISLIPGNYILYLKLDGKFIQSKKLIFIK